MSDRFYRTKAPWKYTFRDASEEQAHADAKNLLALMCPRIGKYLASIGLNPVPCVASWLVGEWAPERRLVRTGLRLALNKAGWSHAYPLAGPWPHQRRA